MVSPVGFASSLPHGSVIDEFQRAGEGLLLAVKRIVDADPTKGRFILTGSANYLASRGITETLAGRVGRVQVWPLSVGERLGHRRSFVDDVFESAGSWAGSPVPIDPAHMIQLVIEGGFPEVALGELTARQRGYWFDAYVNDVVNREALRPIADVRREHELRRTLRAIAARIEGELVVADLARDLELDRSTVTNYIAILEALHLLHLIPAFAPNAATAAKRRSRIHLVDLSLAAHLSGVGERDLAGFSTSPLRGPLIEQFVVGEILKQSEWSERRVTVQHFRDSEGREVDVILEDNATGHVVGIEVKATSTPTNRSARHLRYLRDRLGDRFRLGIVLHLGEATIPLDDRIWLRPASCLWEPSR